MKFFAREGCNVVIDEINTRFFFTPRFDKKREKTIVLLHQLARNISLMKLYFLEERGS